jgi:hypothetical protein
MEAAQCVKSQIDNINLIIIDKCSSDSQDFLMVLIWLPSYIM